MIHADHIKTYSVSYSGVAEDISSVKGLNIIAPLLAGACAFDQNKRQRIFHLSPDVIKAMGQFDGVLLLVLVEHLELDVELLCLFQLLE